MGWHNYNDSTTCWHRYQMKDCIPVKAGQLPNYGSGQLMWVVVATILPPCGQVSMLWPERSVQNVTQIMLLLYPHALTAGSAFL